VRRLLDSNWFWLGLAAVEVGAGVAFLAEGDDWHAGISAVCALVLVAIVTAEEIAADRRTSGRPECRVPGSRRP
jgi:hypothetical protein